jgi:hypothetical protein
MGVAVASIEKKSDGPEEYTWELYDLVGQNVVFRIVDESTSGSIEVDGLRAVKVAP